MATITKSVGTTARDYSTITAWEADLDNAAVYTAGDIAIGECYDDSVFNEFVTIDGGGTIGLSKVVLSVEASSRHDGTAGTGARIVCSASVTSDIVATVPLAGTDKLTVEWLEINGNNQSFSNNRACISNAGAGAGNVPIYKNLILGNVAGSNANSYGVKGEARDIRLINNIIYNITATGSGRSRIGVVLDADDTNGGMFNNTVYRVVGHNAGSAIGIQCMSSVANTSIRNNISAGHVSGTGTTTCFSYAGVSASSYFNNLSDDASADDGGGTGHVISATLANQFVSTVLGSEDLHLKSGSDAIDAGQNLSIIGGFSDDIDGISRTGTWDIGADEFVTSGVSVDVSYVVSFENIKSITDDSGHVIEFVSAVAADYVVLLETLVSALSNLVHNIESSSRINNDSLLNIENIGQTVIVKDSVLNLEFITTINSNGSVIIESIHSLSSNGVVLYENTAGIHNDANPLIESIARLQSDESINIESLIQFARANVSNVENVAGVSAIDSISAESTVGALNTSVIMTENMGGIAVVSDHVLESLFSLASNGVFLVENTSVANTVERLSVFAIENIQSDEIDFTLPFSNRTAVDFTSQAVFENVVSLMRDGGVALEALTSFSHAHVLTQEFTQSVLLNSGLALENRASILVDHIHLYEYLISIGLNRQFAFEVLYAIQQNHITPIEWDGSASSPNHIITVNGIQRTVTVGEINRTVTINSINKTIIIR